MALDMSRSHRKKRVLIFVVAYNAERTIQEVIRRIPASLGLYDTEVLIIDDSSADRTFDQAHDLERAGEGAFPLTVLHNPVSQGARVIEGGYVGSRAELDLCGPTDGLG